MGEAWGIAAVRTPRGKGRKDIGTLVHTHGSWQTPSMATALLSRGAP